MRRPGERPESRVRPPAPRVGATLIAALAVLAAGCGDGGSNSAPASTGTSTTQSTTTAQLPGSGRPAVTVGDKNTPEQFVLGELYEQALAARGFSVSLNRNIGPTGVTIRALRQGSLGLYPEYIDVWNKSVARDGSTFRSPQAAYESGQRYALAHGFELLKPTPFGNTPAIVVTDNFARTHGLRQIGDLGPFSSALTLGGPPQFKSTGLAALERVYNLPPPIYKVLPVGGQYDALDTGGEIGRAACRERV